MADSVKPPKSLTSAGCWLVLIFAFLGWMFAGFHLAISSLVMREAAKDLLGTGSEGQLGQWFGWLITAFLLGAAAGGFIFGRLGDRLGRAKAMALSILCYSTMSAACAGVTEPWQLLLLRFLTCMGVGGMWPNGIALVSEAWPNISRPILAGAIGTAANVGILLFSLLTLFVHVTPDSWRWAMLVGAGPFVVGILSLLVVPESPSWLAVARERNEPSSPNQEPGSGLWEVFRPPLLRLTLVGIVLGTVPLFGGWGSSNWANAWASQVGEAAPQEPDPALKSRVQIARALPGSISSLLGGGLAVLLGRRLCYLVLSCGALFSAQYLFWFLHPADPSFLWWFGALGLFSGFYFGWLPLCLPELFPTHVRSTGAGVSFNFGRILTAFGVIVAGGLLKQVFDGDYAQIGRVTSLIYAVGIVVIFFVPDTSQTTLHNENGQQ